jgi:hypothetical protein
VHGAAFGTYIDQSTKRGDRGFGITDWEMLMARRAVRGGVLRLNVMTSAEPFVLGGSGYPLLLQTGGTYRHSPLRDRQHPHDAIMELAAAYELAPVGGVAFSIYAGAVGEPAIGPPAFMHRPSGDQDPMAPTDNSQMIAQLAQFSSLEQMQQVNDNLIGLAVLQQTNALLQQMTSSAALIGQDVRYVDPATLAETNGRVEAVRIKDGLVVSDEPVGSASPLHA